MSQVIEIFIISCFTYAFAYFNILHRMKQEEKEEKEHFEKKFENYSEEFSGVSDYYNYDNFNDFFNDLTVALMDKTNLKTFLKNSRLNDENYRGVEITYNGNFLIFNPITDEAHKDFSSRRDFKNTGLRYTLEFLIDNDINFKLFYRAYHCYADDDYTLCCSVNRSEDNGRL